MTEKKVAIMTWHHARNYGTALQAYALYRSIKKMGYSVDLIDYRRTGLHTKTVFTYKDFIKQCIQKCRSLFAVSKSKGKNHLIDEKEEQKFESFYAERFTYTAPMRNNVELKKLNQRYDAFVCGSDQIWGPEWLDDKFFLDFVDGAKKIAYAPSIGVSKCEDKYVKAFYKKALEGFEYLSCREEEGCRCLSNILGKAVQQVLDPVLLLSLDEWNELAGNGARGEDEYMVCLFLAYNKKYMMYVQRLAKEKGLELKTFYCTQTAEQGLGNVEGIGPIEYLQIIRDAKYICTDSFHCMVFASIFGVPYTVFKKNKDYDKNSKNSRIYSFLKLFNQEYRLYGSKKYDEKRASRYDNAEFAEKVLSAKQTSLEYLFKALEVGVQESKTISKVATEGLVESSCTTFGNSANSLAKKIPAIGESISGVLDKRVEDLFFDKKTDKKWLEKIIRKGDLFKEECYDCQMSNRFDGGCGIVVRCFNGVRKPIYYTQLKEEVIKRRKSLKRVYLKFYFWNDLYLLLKHERE